MFRVTSWIILSLLFVISLIVCYLMQPMTWFQLNTALLLTSQLSSACDAYDADLLLLLKVCTELTTAL